MTHQISELLPEDEDICDLLPPKCASKECGNDAVCLVFWPGETVRMCATCAARGVVIAAAMGFELAVGNEMEVP